MDREYEFFVTTEEPHHLEGQERGLIRRLVMKNFFENKWSSPAKTASETSSASTVQARTRLKSRFRLPKSDQSKRPLKKASRSKARGASKEEDVGSKKRPKGEQQTSDSSETSTSPDSQTSSQLVSPIIRYETHGTKSFVANDFVVRFNPGAYRLDPFDVLPLPGSPELDTLLRLYKTGAHINAIAANADNTWWPFIRDDVGLLHATLATWALFGKLFCNMKEMRIEKIKHKTEAIRDIRTKIDGPDGISDQLIGIVMILGHFENLIGEYEAAQIHIGALKSMVTARGGLHAFSHNPGLQKGITLLDFHAATVFRTPPCFPRIYPEIDALDLAGLIFQNDLETEAAATSSLTSLFRLSQASVECFNIFHLLHRLATAVSPRWIHTVDKVLLSNLVYILEHMVLSIPDHSGNFISFDLGPAREKDHAYSMRALRADSASITEAILAAVQIFFYSALRGMPLQTKIFNVLLDRLCTALNRPNISIVCCWSSQKNLNTLLWVIVIAVSVASVSSSSSWLLLILVEVIQEMGISDKSGLEESLRRIAWADVLFAEAVDEIWDRICEYEGTMTKNAHDTVVTSDGGGNMTIGGRSLADGDIESFNNPIVFEAVSWKMSKLPAGIV